MKATKYTAEEVLAIHNEALAHAKEAEETYTRLHGEDWFCGFAWVKVLNARSSFARQLVKLGVAEKAWDKGIDIWNPTGNPTQCMNIKEAGASAYAEVLRRHLIQAWMQSRAD